MLSGKTISISTPYGKVKGRLYGNTKSDRVIIFCHGTISLSEYPSIEETAGKFYRGMGVAWFTFDYMGEDLRLDQKHRFKRISHQKRVETIKHITDYFKKTYKKIILEGHSLGTVDAVIAANIYKNVYYKQYLINGVYTFSYYPLRWKLYFYFILVMNTSIAKDLRFALRNFDFKNITIPTLVIVGEKDEILSPKNSYFFYNRLTCPKKLVKVPNGDHALTDALFVKQYATQLRDFITS